MLGIRHTNLADTPFMYLFWEPTNLHSAKRS
jgi:hypothetical protein